MDIYNKYFKNNIIVEVIFFFILTVALIQLVRGIIINIGKYNLLSRQLETVNDSYKTAIHKNKDLKEELNSYLDPMSVEALARKYLNLAGENEVILKIDTNSN